ncbi:ferrichrome ABC transporter substrate-binding protein [Virgibacillus phasianinus]|uniref:Ferrichrome ABC transporter substrate-binding protein n=1 Tax=Virgibacillus phasianinus TaxID=2017483 RepID=A0A220U716_9BACI|nr:iron-siderophore ABC transporter substrate-binding protein [Virgibacillus phasianinus]ASK63696.1 ferrichrome ABC transporter substrate-binding protein [Virgibacillus phasianinus]
MKKILIVVCILFLSLLAACNEPSEEEKKTKDKNTTDREIKIEDAMGTQTLKSTPKNIVVLEWSYAEDLLALGVQPIGVADLDGYNKWVNVDKKLTKSVKDVGTRQEPNLEAISRLKPDLIIAVKYRHEDILDSLKDIAPVVTFAPYSEEATKNQYKNMKEEFKKVATIVDKTEKANLAITDLEEFIEDQKNRIKDAGLEGSKYIATQAFSAQNTPTLRLFTNNSIVSQIMSDLSLENAYESDKVEPYGYSEVTVEALQNFQKENLQFLYIVQNDDNIFENQLKGNPVWENLSFVKNGNTHQLPGDTWTFGGILSAHVLTEQLVDALVEE